ncbi:MAG: DNA mismatch repair protein MutS [Pseudomonadota bacterium]
MAQFLDLQAQHPDHLLFFRMGDFYELFFEDAALAAEALGIALTKRGKHGDEDIPMCGVPIHNAERYLHELIRKGFRVAVAEQLEDPAEAKKRGSKAVVERGVVRLVTPGTLSEDALLERDRHNFLCAIARRGRDLGLAWADMSTGALATQFCPAAALEPTLARLRPAEAVLAAPEDAEIAAAARAHGAAVSELAPSSFRPKRGAARTAELFGVADLDAFGAFDPAEAGALGALIDYLELTQRGRLPRLNPPRREAAEDTLRVDGATRRNLELVRGPDGARAGSLLATIDRTATAGGARLLEAQLSAPLTDPTAIEARLDAVTWFSARGGLRETTRARLRSAPDLERALSRLGLGRGGPRDLANLRDGLAAAQEIAGWIAADIGEGGAILAEATPLDGPAPALISAAADAAQGPDALAELRSTLGAALTDEPPLRLTDGDAFRPGYADALDEARSLRDRAREVIAGLQSRYQDEAGVAALKVKHNNVLGYFIETPATHAQRMMSAPLDQTFRHRQTTANAVRFTTLELTELEAKITRAGDHALALQREIFDALAEQALAAHGPVSAAAAALAQIDVFASHAELAEAERWARPRIDGGRAFRVDEGRHPVVEAALRREGGPPFVPNSCDLSADPTAADEEPSQPIWLVTGPNMAGKSTYLRQNALIAVLAQMGSFVPARAAHLGVVDQLFSRVGAADDLARGRSTFMVEMVETAAILNQSGPRSLVILDEIGRGTATYDGLSIAWATLEHLADVNACRGLFATHYHELTALAAARPTLRNVTVAVREWKGDVIFLREIQPGAADRSYGVQVAKLAGMPRAVTERAQTLLEQLESGEDGPAARAARLVEDLPLFAQAARSDRPDGAPDEAAAGAPALERLAGLDPDAMTPRDALEALYDLKALLHEDG